MNREELLQKLTPRQRAVIEHMLDGASLTGTAKKMGITRSTAAQHVDMARGRLGIRRDGRSLITHIRAMLQESSATPMTSDETRILSDEPRAYTTDELRDLFLQCIWHNVDYWATVEPRDGGVITIQDRCEGLALSLLTMLDGCIARRAMTIRFDPHPEDEEYHKSQGENWIEPGTELSTMLHEYFYKVRPKHDTDEKSTLDPGPTTGGE